MNTAKRLAVVFFVLAGAIVVSRHVFASADAPDWVRAPFGFVLYVYLKHLWDNTY